MCRSKSLLRISIAWILSIFPVSRDSSRLLFEYDWHIRNVQRRKIEMNINSHTILKFESISIDLATRTILSNRRFLFSKMQVAKLTFISLAIIFLSFGRCQVRQYRILPFNFLFRIAIENIIQSV